MAVGAYSARTGNAVHWNPIVEHWSGTSWTRVRLPASASPSSLEHVTCLSTSFCVAVGGTTSAGLTTTGLVVTWNGTAWSAHRLGHTLLNGISCVSRTWCRAAGSEADIPRGRLPILTWNGTRWGTTIDDAPSNATITSIDCPTERACVAIGAKPVQAGSATFAQLWGGGRWREIPVPHDTSAALYAVDCVTRTHCVAVGNTTSLPYRTLVEVWNEARWTVVKSPNNPRLSDNLLNSVSCPAVDRCAAVGWAEDPYQTREAPLIETWSNGHWVMCANARTDDARLWRVSCPSTGACRATGDRGLPKYRTFAESGTP